MRLNASDLISVAGELPSPAITPCPDLNPIEKAFAKLKTLLRKAAERTKEGLWKAIGRIIELFNPGECRRLFESSGYAA